MNASVPPGYKQTEVGVIPDDWDVKPIHALADKIMVGIASAATHAYRDRGVVMFRNQNIKPGYLDDSDILHIAEDYEETYRNKRLKAGDLLTARTGYPGTTSIVPAKYEGSQSFTTLITRPRRDAVDPEYLCCFINSEGGQTYFDQNQTGGGQKNVNAGILKYLPIPLPPTKAEQQAIAEALGDADAWIEALEQLVAKKRRLKQAAMQQLLTGKKRLPGFEGEWDIKQLGKIVECASSGTYGTERPSPNAIPMPVATTAHISDEDRWNSKPMQTRFFTPRQVNDYGVCVGDLVVVKSSGSAASIKSGKIGLVNESLAGTFLFSNFLMRLRPVSILPMFLYYYLTSHDVKRLLPSLVEASTYPNIRINEYLEIDTPVPDTDEQNAIVHFLNDVDNEITALETKLAKARQLKQGMIQELLTGKTRLI